MDDHFLRLSEDALDDSKAGERLILCRKAAEAFCKGIAKDGFPEKVEGNLGRMIQHLYARKLIESNLKVSLEIIRMWANDQSHDNPPDELALPQSLDNLRKLREWYRLNYNEKIKENGQTKIKESDPVEVRFKYYYEAHQNLKSEWFDGKKRYRLFGLSDEALVQEWREFLICYVVTLKELRKKIEKEKDSREKMTLLLSVEGNHLYEVDSLWSETDIADNLKSGIFSNLAALFVGDGQIFRSKLTKLQTNKLINLFNICEEFSCSSEIFKKGKIILEFEGEFNGYKVDDVHSLYNCILRVLSPEMIAFRTQPEFCDQLAIDLYDSSFEFDGSFPKDWPVVFPAGASELSVYNEIVEEIFIFEEENLWINLPIEMWKLMIMVREANTVEIPKNIILVAGSMSECSLTTDTLESLISGNMLDRIHASGSRVIVLSDSTLPDFINRQLVDGSYHWSKDRSDAKAYIETSSKIKKFVTVEGASLVVNLPLNLSRSITRVLLEEIERSINQNSNSSVSSIFVRATDLPDELNSEVDEFLHSFNIFLQCFSPYPFPRACVVRNIKEGSKCSPWIYTTSLEEAEYEIKQADPPAKTDRHNDQVQLLLTKSGLLTKIDSLRRFLNQYDNPNEILLLEDSGFDSSFLYFTENGRCYWGTNKHLPWYPANTTAHDAMQTQHEEKMTCALEIKDFNSGESVVLCTANGVVKKSQLTAYSNFKKGGFIGINIDEGDLLRHAVKINPKDDILILTQGGKGLRFSSDHQLRDQGRVTRGVRGIRLKSDDEVVSMLRVDDSKYLLLVSRSGLFLKTKYAAFLPRGEAHEDATPRKRGGQGVTAMDTEAVCTAIQVDTESEILIVTEMGKSAIVRTQNIRESNRGHKGVRGIRLDSGDAVQSVFLVP